MAVHPGKLPLRTPVDTQVDFGAPSLYRTAHSVNPKRYGISKSGRPFLQRGVASWYGRPFHRGKTASGEIYDMYEMTAAHRVLPLRSYAEVTNLRNGHKVLVRVDDRGPFHPDRVIDLSYAAALELGIVAKGTCLVEVRAIGNRYREKRVQPSWLRRG
ncbi:MAG: septal ring lytic transglycosylase RlpA family protein [Gammaproteobacteria bacterium]